MEFIDENKIEEAMLSIQKIDKEMDLQWAEFATEQPALAEFLFAPSFEVLTKDERDYLLFLSRVIYTSCEAQLPADFKVNLEKLSAKEEANWDLWSQTKQGSFKEKLDIFFEGTPQEDLLAFIEDSLFYDEDNAISKIGREPMFIALKTIVDVLTK